MKIRNYERQSLIQLLAIILILSQGVTIFLLTQIKIETFQKIGGVIVRKDLAAIIVNQEEAKLFQQNKNLYIKNKKIPFEIEEDRGKIVTKKNQEYRELWIHLKKSTDYKIQDMIEISIHKNNIQLIKIFKIIWEGD